MNNNYTPQISTDDENIGLRPLIIDYLTHWRLILAVGLFACLIGVLYLVFFPKTYETTARIQIQNEDDMLSSGGLGLGEAAGLMRSFGLGGGGSSSINIDDEKVTLLSNNLLAQMVEDLGLHVEYSYPYTFGIKLYGDAPLVVSCDSAMTSKLRDNVKFDIRVNANGSVVIKAESESLDYDEKLSFTSLPATVKIKDYEYHVDYANNSTARNQDIRLLVSVNPPKWTAEAFEEDFDVEEYSKMSNIIEMRYTDYERQRAEDMFNTLVTLYNKQALEYKRDLSLKQLTFITARLNSTIDDLAKVEQRIEEYKSKNAITMVEVDVLLYAESMKELQTKMIELSSEMHLIELMDEFVKNEDNRYKLVPSLLTIPEGEASPLALYNQALLERERMIKNGSIDNPLVKSLTAQADQLRESVYTMINNARQSMDATQKELKAKENEILAKMSSVPAQERTYVQLRREQEILQGVYLILLQKREEIALSLGQMNSKARIIDGAYTKSIPLQPRKLFAAIGVILFTFIITVGWLVGKSITLSIWSDLKPKL